MCSYELHYSLIDGACHVELELWVVCQKHVVEVLMGEHLKDAGRREWFAGLTVVAVPYLPHVPIVAFEVIVEVCYEHG